MWFVKFQEGFAHHTGDVSRIFFMTFYIVMMVRYFLSTALKIEDFKLICDSILSHLLSLTVNYL